RGGGRGRRARPAGARRPGAAPRGGPAPPGAARRDAAMSRAFAGACAKAGVRRLVLASSAAVYGAGAGPVSGYGEAKRAAEVAVRAAFSGPGQGHAVLRCFNVAGADPENRAGPGRGLVRVACEAALGMRGDVTVFGTGRDTADGTCVRDWVHVCDVAAAHLAALRALEGGTDALTADVGAGRGHSVRAVLAAVERAAGARIAVRAGSPRPGDVAVSVAAPERIARLPGWRARDGSLDAAVRSTLAWLRAEARALPGPGPRREAAR
ncbi:MAG: NAD-dependent epimerase/dehydratase family protein, partial [Alphaproteobacteria bacterium]|nr:NAD-dependent epimerase/dehydratase family protein [Alphaproteobacteria bacterium]